MNITLTNRGAATFMLLITLLGFIVAMILLFSASPIHFSSPTQAEVKERIAIQAKWDEMITAIQDEDEEKIGEIGRWLDKHAGTTFEKLEVAKARLICAWCGIDMGEANTSQDTHGICEPCKSIHFTPE